MLKRIAYLTSGLVLLLMLASVGCQSEFNITGEWLLIAKWNINSKSLYNHADFQAKRAWTDTITFTGTAISGTWISKNNPTTSAGTYTVSGESVTFVDNLFTIVTYTGTTTDNDNIEGTMIDALGVGTFTMTRN